MKPDGTVKVLDFGLAKSFGPEGANGAAPGLSNSPEPLLLPDDTSTDSYQLPEFLPGGKSILFDSFPRGGGLDGHRIEVLDLSTKARQVVIPGGAAARYNPPAT